MRRGRAWARCGLPVTALALAATAMAEGFTFDSSAFEKKPFEVGGYLEVKQEGLRLNRDGTFYRLANVGLPPRDRLDRTSATLQLAGLVRQGIGTFDFRTNSTLQRDQAARSHANDVFEAAYSLRPDADLTFEAGKRALRWGKGYAWNPIGFVERLKDPSDPQLAREGFVILGADWIASPGGALRTIAFTPVLLPVRDHLNEDFGARGHVNAAAKLYLLYRDTDIDFAWQGKGSRPARFGMDLSRNLAGNLEIHGEWARTRQLTKPVVDAAGRVATEPGDATSYLLGTRYLAEGDTTYIAEYYRNGAGYRQAQLDQFNALVDNGLAQLEQAGSGALVQRALSLQGAYGRPNPGTDYAYLRAQRKDAFGVVYLSAAVTAIANLRDRSFQLAPELQYNGYGNLELRVRLFVPRGRDGTEFGEKAVARKLELSGRYHF